MSVLSWVRFLGCVGVVMGCLNSALAEVDGDIAHLEEVAEKHLQNYRAIRQWRGQAELRHQVYEDDHWIDQQSRVEFAEDFEQEAVCFSWIVKHNLAQYYGKPPTLIDSMKGGRIGALVYQGDYYAMQLTNMGSGEQANVTLTNPRKHGAPHVAQEFFPHGYLYIGTDDPEEFFPFYIKRLPNEDWAYLTIRRDGDLVHLTSKNKTTSSDGMQYVFDLRQGGSLVKFVTGTSYHLDTTTTEFSKVNGLYLPTHFHYWRQSKPEDKKLLDIDVRWVRQTVNEPIPKECFTLEFMGAPPGTPVLDARLMQTYIYRPKESEPAQRTTPDTIPVTSQSPAVDPQLPPVVNRPVDQPFPWAIALAITVPLFMAAAYYFLTKK